MKFVFPALVSLIMPFAFAFTGQIRKPLLVLCVLSLQADYVWILGDAGSSWVGSSGPSRPFVAFGSVACIAYLLYDRLFAQYPERSRFMWGKAAVTVPFLLMTLATALTIFYTPERMVAVYALQVPLNHYLFFLVGLNASRSREDFAVVLKCLMIVLATQSLVYFVQNGLGVGFNLRGEMITRGATQFEVQSHGGTVGTAPAAFASFILPLLFIGVSRFLFTRSRRDRRHMFILGGMGLVALLITVTRAAWVGFAIGSLWMSALAARRGAVKTRLGALVAGGCLAIALAWPLMALRVESGGLTGALDARTTLMSTAWRIIEDSPVLGVGAGAYGFVFREYLTRESTGDWQFIVHNVYLLTWAETGVLGLVALLSFWFLGFRDAMRATRAANPTTVAIGVGWSAAILALMWEMWWDMSLGHQGESLVWFLRGMIIVAPRVALTQTALEASPRRSMLTHPALRWQPR
jgi:O-antigen ligase